MPGWLRSLLGLQNGGRLTTPSFPLELPDYYTHSSSFPVRLIPDKHSPRLDALTENPSDSMPSSLFFPFIRITPSHACPIKPTIFLSATISLIADHHHRRSLFHCFLIVLGYTTRGGGRGFAALIPAYYSLAAKRSAYVWRASCHKSQRHSKSSPPLFFVPPLQITLREALFPSFHI